MKKDLENMIKLKNGRMNPTLSTLEKIAGLSRHSFSVGGSVGDFQ